MRRAPFVKRVEEFEGLKDIAIPHDANAEKVLLGSVILDNAHMAHLVEYGFEPGDFYVRAHEFTYRGMLLLHNEGREIDPLSLIDALRQEGLLDNMSSEPMTFIAELTYGLPHFSNLATTAKMVKDCSRLREALRIQQYNTSIILDRAESAEMILAQVEANTLEVIGNALRRANRRSPEFIDAGEDEGRFDQMLVDWNEGRSADALETPLPWLNERLEGGGLQRQGVYIIGAPPKVGKTSLLLWWANYWVNVLKVPGGIIEMEMSRYSLLKRLFAQYTGIPMWMFRRGFRGPEFAQARKMVKPFFADLRGRLHIVDSINTISQFRHAARRIVLGPTQAQWIGVDYLQLAAVTAERDPRNRATETGLVIQELKNMAQELNVPIVGISTLTQEGEREGRRPELTDLAWSGDLRYAAEAVIFLHNADYKRAMSREQRMTFDSLKSWQIDLILAAQRNGPTGERRLNFLRNMMQFADMNVDVDERAYDPRTIAPPPEEPDFFNVPGPLLVPQDEGQDLWLS